MGTIDAALRLLVLAPALALCGGCRLGTTPTQVTGSALRFVDVTTGSGIDFRHRNGANGKRYFPEMMGAGCAVFDYDSDGWNDVFLVQGTPLPGTSVEGDWRCRLFRGGPGLRFTEVTERARVGAHRLYGMGCAVGDIDNDGHPDLLINGFGGSMLYRNRGDGSFEDWTARARVSKPGFWTSAAFLDYDGDGRLDLYSCQYVTYEIGDDEACSVTQGLHTYCAPKSFPGSASALYRNEGGGRFRDVTRSAGASLPTGKSLGVVVDDFDGNGWPDLYVANDTVRNFMFMNHDGKFVERAVEAGTALGSAGVAYGGMGVDTGDLDGDQRPEILVTNFRLEPNSLYLNENGRSFFESADVNGLTGDSRNWVGFGCGLEDFDLDGQLDALIVNGHVYDNTQQFTPGDRTAQPPRLLRGDERGHFTPVAEAGPWFDGNYVGRGVAFGDLDNDGDTDVIVTTNDGPAFVLRNDSRGSRHWLQVRLIGSRSNRMGIGATVTVTSRGRNTRRFARSSRGYQSSSDVRLTFGLADASNLDCVEVRWPSGATNVLKNVPADQLVSVREPGVNPRQRN